MKTLGFRHILDCPKGRPKAEMIPFASQVAKKVHTRIRHCSCMHFFWSPRALLADVWAPKVAFRLSAQGRKVLPGVKQKCIHESDIVLVSTFGGCLGSCDEMRYDEMRRTEMKSDESFLSYGVSEANPTPVPKGGSLGSPPMRSYVLAKL